MIAQGAALFACFLQDLQQGLIASMEAWLFSLIFLALLLMCSEAGFRFGTRSNLKVHQPTKGRTSSIEAAVLGVLGLLLAFTLVMAVSRFDTRRQVVLDEANALNSAHWLSQLVAGPEGAELSRLLREYLNVEVHFFDGGTDSGHLRASREQAARLQNEIWSRASASAPRLPPSVPLVLLLQSLNQAFNLENSRVTALAVRVPDGVLWVDIFVGLLAALLVGYNFGLTGQRHFVSALSLAVCIAAVLAVTMDLDQPRQGLIRVSDQPLVDLQHEIDPK
jgi:hypothetical protein